jgi:hypothetical protein
VSSAGSIGERNGRRQPGNDRLATALGRRIHLMAGTAVLAAVGLALSACLPVVVANPGTSGVKPKPVVPAALIGTSSVAGLDSTGNTIPSTRYSTPKGAVYMSPSGRDSNAGSLSTPVLTLAHAYTLVPAGGTIVARGGTYRDGNLIAGKTLTLQAYPGEQPWFDGTDVVRNWTSDGSGHWYVGWSTPDFCQNAGTSIGAYYTQTWPWLGTPGPAGPCIHSDMANDPGNPGAADPQMVFLGGRYLTEVTSLAKVTSTSFWYDFAARRVYIAATPTGHMLEVTRRANAIVTTNLTTGSRFLGVGFRRYASNEKNEGNATHGAVTVQGTPGILFENDTFAQNAGTALNFLSGAKNAIVTRDVFARNGFNGVDANGSENKDNFTITGSLFE